MRALERLSDTRSRTMRWSFAILLLLSTTVMAADPDMEGLVLYLPCEDAANPIDASADPATVTVLGSLSSVDGQLGTMGLGFDGNAANRLEVTSAAKLEGMSALTIEAWVLGQNVASYEGMSVASKRNAYQDGDVYNLFTWTGQNVNARVNGQGGSALVSTTAIADDTWYHIAFAFDGAGATGDKVRLYINGVLEASGDHPDNAVGTGGAPVWIGELDANRGFAWDGVMDEIGIWNIPLTQEDVELLMVQTKAKLLGGELASSPQPTDGAEDVPVDTDLAWAAGDFAATHNVHFGPSLEDVTASDPGTLIAEGLALDTTSVDVGRMDFGQTYYWRVDEVNGAPDFTVYAGDIWSFTTEPLAYPIENVLASTNGVSDATAGPENIVNGSGLNDTDEHSIESSDMWLVTPGADPLWVQFEFDGLYKLHEMLVWNYNVQFELVLGFGVKGVTVEYSADGLDWAVLGDAELAQATARADYTANSAIDFGGVAARFVRLAVNSGHGPMGQFGLSEVRFTSIPVQAREPQPADAATGVAVETTLAWRSGREAAAHDVYLDTAPDALALADAVTDNSYTPADLQFGTTYYWRIDEVNEAEAISVWASDLWSFSTLEYVVIDDMEGYDDDANTIFDTWLDGFVNGTGSTVGYFNAPFAETSIVNSGGQSMPLEYVNDASPFYSEAEYDMGSMNLDTNGADTLRLFVSGQAPAFFETADGRILMNGIGNDIWGSADQFRYAYKNLTGDGSITARVDALDGSPNPWAKGGVMVRQSTEAGAINVFMALTGGDGGGATYQQRMEADAASISQHTYADGPFAPPYWVRVTREGNTLLGYTSPDGENWTQRGDVVTLAMADPVLIGLALTSHNVAQATSAEFSNVSTTGNVSASWEMAEIGATQPIGNDVAPLYVALEDTSGNVAVVTHPDASIVARSGWNEWLIPYTDLAAVNLSRVAIMYIGVGDRDNPTAGGTGLIFVDDIGYGHPASGN